MVNEPSVFEPLRVYCIYLVKTMQKTKVGTSRIMVKAKKITNKQKKIYIQQVGYRIVTKCSRCTVRIVFQAWSLQLTAIRCNLFGRYERHTTVCIIVLAFSVYF